jgi:hypothetical protein
MSDDTTEETVDVSPDAPIDMAAVSAALMGEDPPEEKEQSEASDDEPEPDPDGDGEESEEEATEEENEGDEEDPEKEDPEKKEEPEEKPKKRGSPAWKHQQARKLKKQAESLYEQTQAREQQLNQREQTLQTHEKQIQALAELAHSDPERLLAEIGRRAGFTADTLMERIAQKRLYGEDPEAKKPANPEVAALRAELQELKEAQKQRREQQTQESFRREVAGETDQVLKFSDEGSERYEHFASLPQARRESLARDAVLALKQHGVTKPIDFVCQVLDDMVKEEYTEIETRRSRIRGRGKPAVGESAKPEGSRSRRSRRKAGKSATITGSNAGETGAARRELTKDERLAKASALINGL